MRTLLNLLCICLLASFAGAAFALGTPDGQPPSVEEICSDLQWVSGPAFGLCNAYCEAMDCDCGNVYNPGCTPHASGTACERVLGRFEDRTSGRIIPCEPSCGNGILDADLGEACADGDIIDGDGCSSTCTIEGGGVCGDGTVDPGEDCDEGDNNNGDGCTFDCKFECPCNLPAIPGVPDLRSQSSGFTRWQQYVGSPEVTITVPFPTTIPAVPPSETANACNVVGTTIELEDQIGGSGDETSIGIAVDLAVGSEQCTAFSRDEAGTTTVDATYQPLNADQANACKLVIEARAAELSLTCN